MLNKNFFLVFNLFLLNNFTVFKLNNFTVFNFIKNHKKKITAVVLIGVLLYFEKKYNNNMKKELNLKKQLKSEKNFNNSNIEYEKKFYFNKNDKVLNINNLKEQLKSKNPNEQLNIKINKNEEIEKLKKDFYEDLELTKTSEINVLIKNEKVIPKNALNNILEKDISSIKNTTVKKINLYENINNYQLKIDNYKLEIESLNCNYDISIDNFNLLFNQISFVKKVIDFNNDFYEKFNFEGEYKENITMLDEFNFETTYNNILKLKEELKDEKINNFFIKWLNLIKNNEKIYYYFISLMKYIEFENEKRIVQYMILNKKDINDECKVFYRDRIKKTILIYKNENENKNEIFIEKLSEVFNDDNQFNHYFKDLVIYDLNNLYEYKNYSLYHVSIKDYLNNLYKFLIEEDQNKDQNKDEEIKNKKTLFLTN